jgi:hypothetical protein
LLGGFGGFTMLHLHCPITLPEHLMLGHVSLVFVSLVLGFFLGRR